ELGAYLEIETEENIARGMSAEQARQAAHRKLGNATLIREEIYRMNSIGFVESCWQDVRYSLRTLAKARAFTFVVIASLALGIGANTAIFSLINAALLKMLPVTDPEQLVELENVSPVWGLMGFSYPAFKAFRDQNQALSGVLAFFKLNSDVDLEMNGQSGLAKGQVISGDYFSTLGIRPAIGRLITPADETVAGQSPVAVISYDYWRRRFALDPAVIGKKVVLNSSPFTIIGATPPEFFGLQTGEKIDISVPITMIHQVNPTAQAGTRFDLLTAPYSRWLHVMARLKPGVTPKAALANLDPIFHRTMREGAASLPFASPRSRRLYLASTLQLDSGGKGLAALRRQFSKPLWILMGMVGLLLLVTCANVANLLLARANVRQKEIAVRLTVGAGRWRMIRQLLTESALLALCGGAVGLLLAFWASRSLLALMSHSDSPISLSVRPDTTVLGFTLLLSLLTAFLFGFLPTWRATRLNAASALVESTRSTGGDGNRSRLGKTLIALQVAMSLALLTGAGLLARSLENLKNFYPGFNKENVLLLSVNPGVIGYQKNQAARLYQHLLDQITRTPGVRSATFSLFSPLRGCLTCTVPKVEEVTPQSGKEIKRAGFNEIGPNYFRTLEAAVLSGRDFTYTDQAGAPRVSIVNEAMAHEYFGDKDPIGKHLSVPDWKGDPSWLEIVGVVRNAKHHDLRERTTPMIYLPLLQSPDTAVTFEVRTAMNPLNLTAAILRAVKEADSRIPVYDVESLNQQVDESLIQQRLVASLSGLFGLLALILAAVGLYGLMTYAMNRRTSEIGIRIALGATRGQIAGMVLREALLLVLVGLVIGVPAAMAASHLIRNELFGLNADDPVTIGIASLVMASIALLAGYLPARRASHVDPMIALRAE
ncbi:MAG TPA: ABC transporter permease, partial [Bryobacteraceae bacterium]